jgi:S-sulfosulfanyl-L-cysteine sulfohydrolase
MQRREFLQALAIASLACGNLALARAEDVSTRLYELPRRRHAASLIHITDCHAQLLPVHFREPDTNIGVGGNRGQPQHLTGEALLKHYGLRPGSRLAYAFSHVDFQKLASRYGRMGGFAHIATLISRIRAQRPGAMVVDGGDSWQGSATSLWTRGADMVEACKLLGVAAMTGHWEFTLGAERVKELVQGPMRGAIEFVAHNVFDREFGDRVFKPYVMREINGLNVAVIGQAYPYTPIANPQYLVPDWTFGIHEESLQNTISEARARGAAAVVLLSHNGIDVDLKLAGRISGIDAILGGHTHDALPRPIRIRNPGGETLVANGGSNGKFVGVLDISVESGRNRCEYSLMPVFSDLLEPDPSMAALISRLRSPFEQNLRRRIAVAGDLLYRRGNFNGSFDELVLRALMQSQGTRIAFSPGFRWGTTVLAGDDITLEDIMAQTAITYPDVTLRTYTGADIKNTLEDIADNLFHPDPYYRQGGDMVRTAGIQYACDPWAPLGKRISNMRAGGVPIEAGHEYRVAGWAAVSEPDARGIPVWELLEQYLTEQGVARVRSINTPDLPREKGNP